jgi:hypothetical protein
MGELQEVRLTLDDDAPVRIVVNGLDGQALLIAVVDGVVQIYPDR